jgi:hypothetical protein
MSIYISISIDIDIYISYHWYVESVMWYIDIYHVNGIYMSMGIYIYVKGYTYRYIISCHWYVDSVLCLILLDHTVPNVTAYGHHNLGGDPSNPVPQGSSPEVLLPLHPGVRKTTTESSSSISCWPPGFGREIQFFWRKWWQKAPYYIFKRGHHYLKVRVTYVVPSFGGQSELKAKVIYCV